VVIWAQETTTTVTEAVAGTTSFDWQVVVGIGGVLVGLVALLLSWLQGRRQERTHAASLKSEEKRHAERLGLERRVAHEARAAEAYLKADSALGVMEWGLFDKYVRYDADKLAETGRMMRDAIGAVTQAKFYAWSDSMALACSELIESAVELENKASASRDAIRSWLKDAAEAEQFGGSKPDQGTLARIEGQYRDIWGGYAESVEEYRQSARFTEDDD
jgi:hypothetical protein